MSWYSGPPTDSRVLSHLVGKQSSQSFQRHRQSHRLIDSHSKRDVLKIRVGFTPMYTLSQLLGCAANAFCWACRANSMSGRRISKQRSLRGSMPLPAEELAAGRLRHIQTSPWKVSTTSCKGQLLASTRTRQRPCRLCPKQDSVPHSSHTWKWALAWKAASRWLLETVAAVVTRGLPRESGTWRLRSSRHVAS